MVASDCEDSVSEGIVDATVGLLGSLAVCRWHAVHLVIERLIWILLHLSALEFHDEFGLEVLIPRHNDLCHLAELRQSVRTDEEVIGEIDLTLGARLVNIERRVVASKIEVGEAPLEDDISRSRRQTDDFLAELLIPTLLRIELDLGQRRKHNINADELRTLVTVEAHSLSPLHFMLQFLAHLDQLALEVLILGGHGLGAIVLVVALLINDDIALVTANSTMLASRLMGRVVLLEHLVLAPVVRALDDRVPALSLMPFQIQVVDDLCAAFVFVLAARLNLAQLSGEDGVRINQLEAHRAAIRAADIIPSLDKLIDVVVDVLLAKALSALTALARIDHHILAQDAVKKRIVLHVRSVGLTSLNL